MKKNEHQVEGDDSQDELVFDNHEVIQSEAAGHETKDDTATDIVAEDSNDTDLFSIGKECPPQFISLGQILHKRYRLIYFSFSFGLPKYFPLPSLAAPTGWCQERHPLACVGRWPLESFSSWI